MSQFMLDFSDNPPRWPLPKANEGKRRSGRRWLTWTVLFLALVSWWASLLGFFWYSSENRFLRRLYHTQVLRHDSLLGAHLDVQKRLYRLQHELERARPVKHRAGATKAAASFR